MKAELPVIQIGSAVRSGEDEITLHVTTLEHGHMTYKISLAHAASFAGRITYALAKQPKDR